MWKVLICDSDLSFSEELKRKSLAIAEEGVQGVKLFRGKADLEQYVSAHPDEANMVFLEVELEGGFGIEAGKKVLQMQPDSQLIFISAKDTYYQEVYEVDHVYLLKKPFEDECLKQAVRRAEKKLDQAVDHIRGKFGSDTICRGAILRSDLQVGKKYKSQLDDKKK